ncbi:hypothetical protein HPB49_001635 [Dermacentor silvarum]|uniref:Uncharacterized protein n=1 Tax=Dermacentor silvarum TaxID=543639 RepID=A0ACB8C6X0_DERSI|nr:hypothetical protein HPB49_001635 [Dermacentor silvarum]
MLVSAQPPTGTNGAVLLQITAILQFIIYGDAGQAVSKDAPVVTPFSFPTDLSEGSPAQVFCAISKGALPVYFTWLKDGKTVSGDNLKVTAFERYSVLQVLQVSAADVGNYTCFAKNLQGSDSYSVKLEVRAPPRWLRVPSDVSALLGSEARLSCPVAGYPTPKVTWNKMTDGNRARLEASQSLTLDPSGVLVLHSVQPRDRGVYLCEADNGVGEPITNRVRLALNVPARFEEKSTVVTARRTEVTRMKCQATGDQPLSIAWSKGTVKLDKRTSARYEVFETLTPDGLISELVIRDTDRSDGALYTCHTQNKYGKDDRKVKLIVQEVPGPPQDVRLKDVWSRSASVSWSPSYSGNSPISKYIVQVLEGPRYVTAATQSHRKCLPNDGRHDNFYAKPGKITTRVSRWHDSLCPLEETLSRAPDLSHIDSSSPLSSSAATHMCPKIVAPSLWFISSGVQERAPASEAAEKQRRNQTAGREQTAPFVGNALRRAVGNNRGPTRLPPRSVSYKPRQSLTSLPPRFRQRLRYVKTFNGTAHRLHELEVIGSMTYTMVRDLLPGTAYVLNLVAENAIGRGEPSRTVVFHTGEEEPEAAPVDILVEMKGPSTVYISWKAPPREHWNGHLLGYYIGYRPRDTESPFSYRRVEASPNNASHEYLLGGLQRGTEYLLVLKAYNSAGSGPASQEKTVRTMDGDVPEAPRLFVTGVSADTMTLRWVIRSSSDVTGFNIHYRQEGGTWLELPIVNTANNTYTLTNLHPGYVYQVYVTASNVLGRGDPSAILLVKTESTASGHESSAIENKQADDEVPIYMDMAIMIPAGAILLAVLVILFSTCICIRKMKSTPRPVPEIMRYDPATLNTGTMMSQRYVEMEKMSEQDVPFATPYEGGTMRNGTELRGTLKERQEMKTYVPKHPMKDRPLPHPEQSPLRMDETYYDSAQ